jgi:glutamate synthase domain-containing protein 3
MERVIEFDLAQRSVRELNEFLHGPAAELAGRMVRVKHPQGKHNLAVGLNADVELEIAGDAGYFVAGMNQRARVMVQGNVGRSVAENMMSGAVRVRGNASESAGASAHGGLLVIDGDAGSRCGISLKGGEIVVGGNVGHMSAFMAQAGAIVVCGDAGPGLGDSLYEAVIYVKGTIAGLGADARTEPMSEADHVRVGRLLDQAGFRHDPRAFQRVASARTLYHWNSEVHQEY